MRRREDVLEQRRQQQREGMDMMRKCRRNHTGKTNGIGKQQDIEVQFYGEFEYRMLVGVSFSVSISFSCLGLSSKPLGYGVSKLNGERVVQGSKVEMCTRPWKTRHVTYELEDALRAVNSQSNKRADTPANRDSLEGSPASPAGDENKHVASGTQNSVKIESRAVQPSPSVGGEFTAAFMRSHATGHRAIQSSDLALEDIAPDDAVEGIGGSSTAYCLVTMAGGKQTRACGDQGADLSMDSIEGGLDASEATRPDESKMSRSQHENRRESHVDNVSDLLPQEAGQTRSRREADVSLPIPTVDDSIASQRVRLNGRMSHEMSQRLVASIPNHVAEKTSDVQSVTQHLSLTTDVETHSMTSPSPSLRDSLDNALLHESKSPSNAPVEPTIAMSSKREPSSIRTSINARETVENREPESHDIAPSAARPEHVAPSSMVRSRGSRDHLFMSSVVMNTSASSTVQAALSQYLAGRPSAMSSSKQVTSNSFKNQSLGHVGSQSGLACRRDSRLQTDGSNDELSVAVASKLGETVDCDTGFKLREASSEQKLTGILKKPGAKRPSSASGVDAMRSRLDGATSDMMKKTVRFADFHHNVKFISSSPVDSPAESSIKLRKKRSHSAPAVSRTARHPQKTDTTVARLEAALVASIARKSAQSQLKPVGTVKTVTGNRTTKKGWELKGASDSGGVVMDPSSLKKAGLVDTVEGRGEDMVGGDQLDVGASISLEKTPTDDEINQLWKTVRARLQYENGIDPASGPTPSRSTVGESSRGLKVRCVYEGNEPVSVGEMGIQSDTYHYRNRSHLTNRPTISAPVFAFRDLSQDLNTAKQILQPTARPPSPVVTIQSVSHPQPEPGIAATSVYSDSLHTVVSRPPAYVRHYQQQAELALARGSMRVPAAARSYRLPSKSREMASGKSGSDRVGAREGHGRLPSNGKKRGLEFFPYCDVSLM